MMLCVLIDNLVIVDHAEFEPGPGMTVVTGETGAGKTLLATAIALLFGSDADGSQVGPRADHAWVEGEFELTDEQWEDPAIAVLRELRPEDESTLVLARKVSANGRSRALAWGRTVSKVDLAAAGRLLVATAGQHAGRKLVSASWQRALVDRAGGEAHAVLLADMARAHATWVEAVAAAEAIELEAATIAQRAEQIADEIAHIDAVEPTLEDHVELMAQRNRARHHAALHESLATAWSALASDDSPVGDAVGRAASEVASAATLDSTLEPLAAQVAELQVGVADVAMELRGRLEDLSDAPAAIDDIERRLSAYDELIRRYGGTIEAVLAHRADLERQSALVTSSDEVVAAAHARVADAHAAAVDAAAAVSERRTLIGARIADDVAHLLADLGMADSVFMVAVEPAALSAHGADRVELRIAPHASHTPRPIADVASGGELSRLALAVHLATGEGDAPTLIFDEIDAGIGGHTAHAMATMLKRLSEHAQVICITHLPQIAARADHHVVIEKSNGTTTLTMLTGDDAVVDELCRMLGGVSSDQATRDHALQLRGPRYFGDASTQLQLDDDRAASR